MIKPKVILESARHRDAAVVKIVFERNHKIQAELKALAGLRWSQSMQSWYVSYRETVVKELFQLLGSVSV